MNQGFGAKKKGIGGLSKSIMSLGNSFADNLRRGSIFGGGGTEDVEEQKSTVLDTEGNFDTCNFPTNNVQLLHTERKVMALKNFKDIDAQTAMDRAINDSIMIPCEKSMDFDKIIQNLIDKVCDDMKLALSHEQRVKVGNALFTVSESLDDAEDGKDNDSSDGAWGGDTSDIQLLNETIQAVSITEGGMCYQHTWLICMGKTKHITKPVVAISKLNRHLNLGKHCREVRFIVMVLVPDKRVAGANANAAKTALEIARTFGTLFSDVRFHSEFLQAKTVEKMHEVLAEERRLMATKSSEAVISQPSKSRIGGKKNARMSMVMKRDAMGPLPMPVYQVFKGIWWDLSGRIPHYVSDWTDAFKTELSLSRTMSASVFVFFACFLPSIAFGNTNAQTTEDWINVEKTIYAQTLGGIFFALFSAQPLVLLLTTAPIALYIKIIKKVAFSYRIPFAPFYTAVGLWNALFLMIYSVTNCSRIMRYSTRSCEEIFALFTAATYIFDAKYHIQDAFTDYYNNDDAIQKYVNVSGQADEHGQWNIVKLNDTLHENVTEENVYMGFTECSRDKAILWLALALGTVWLGMFLFNFRKSPYLNGASREFFSDYSLACAVIIMSLVGSHLFKEVKFEPFYLKPGGEWPFTYQEIEISDTKCTYFKEDPATGVMTNLFKTSMCLNKEHLYMAGGLGFCMSLLFFLDQGFGEALTNSHQHKLVKPSGYHWDLLLVSIINGGLSFFGLPWIHGALPHSPLHVRALAVVEERVEDGYISEEIVMVSEQRISALFSHIMIGCTLFFLNFFTVIPKPVFDGLFLFVAVTSLFGNQFFERLGLIVTDRASYPPSHYLRRVPVNIVHTFTCIQLVQLSVCCLMAFGFFGLQLKLVFPVIIFMLILIRRFILPEIFKREHLEALDGH